MPYPSSYFNTPNQPALKPGQQMWGGFGPPQGMPGYSPTQMSGFLNLGGTPTFSNQWTAHMLRPQDIKPQVQQQFNGVTPQQMTSARNSFRASLGMGPVQQRQQPMSPMQQNGPMQPMGPNMRQLSAPSGGVYQQQPQMAPQQPAVGGSSFANSPERQWTPQEQAQMASMERQHQNMKLGDQNLPRWQGNVNELNRQADVMERRQLPDVNDPNYRPADWKDNLTDIPGSMWGQYRDRFNAINRNRQQTETPQPTMLSQMPQTGNFPDYQKQLAEANPEMAANVNNPTYMADNRITPLPRSNGMLTPQEAAQMRAVGSSEGEWRAKSDWMRSKGYEGQMTPAQSQEYANERQKAQLDRNARAFDVEQRRNAIADIRRERKLKNREQNFRYNNPELFADINPNAAQMIGMMNGAPLRQFTPDGQMTPRDNLAFNLQYRNQLLDQLQMHMAEGNAEAAGAVQQQIQGIDSAMQNATVFDGLAPQQGQGMPANPYRDPRWLPPQQPPQQTPRQAAYGGYSSGVPMWSY